MRRCRLDEVEVAQNLPPDELLALDEALDKLQHEDPEKATLIRLRFFLGLSHEEAGRVVGISAVTAMRRWRYARAWLYRELRRGGGVPPAD